MKSSSHYDNMVLKMQRFNIASSKICFNIASSMTRLSATQNQHSALWAESGVKKRQQTHPRWLPLSPISVKVIWRYKWQYKVFQGHSRARRISVGISGFNSTLVLLVDFQIVGFSYLSSASLKYVGMLLPTNLDISSCYCIMYIYAHASLCLRFTRNCFNKHILNGKWIFFI